ncbi:MAG: adenylate/guanylate cyclase domain-containing protein [Chloroflexota bacterium]|nr:adenylate/guanylate cyclase domain-containing protein [Chloroflexota bacterium]
MTTPGVRYARSGEASIAYQVVGDGPVDLVWIGGPAAHLDMEWENPTAARAMEQLASFTRLVRFDRRGTGLSDPVEEPPTLEQQMDDLRAVMDAVGLERAALFGGTDAGLGALFAGTHPDRVSALVLWGVAARAADAITPELVERFGHALEHYGEGRFVEIYAPSRVGDPRFEEWWTRYERAAASPGMARKLLELPSQTDISAILPSIRVPTLVLHRSGDALVPIDLGRDLASRIPDARFVELPGIDPYGWASNVEPVLDALEEFLTGSLGAREPDRVLATVLFTDVVGSTEHAARLGDRGWRELLERHDALVRQQLQRWRGREVKTVGDGFLATFDGPGRAVRCADAILKSVEPIGLQVRAGLHTGECELMGDDVGGIAVHIGARVAALAKGGEVVASSTVRDLVVGSGLAFEDRGVHRLKGAPGEWRLFALEDGAS